MKKCPYCDGDGKCYDEDGNIILGKKCPECKGTGYIKQENNEDEMNEIRRRI